MAITEATPHYLQGNDAADAHDAVPHVDAHNAVPPVDAHTAVFVTERRRKGRTAKRKISDSTPVPAQVYMSSISF